MSTRDRLKPGGLKCSFERCTKDAEIARLEARVHALTEELSDIKTSFRRTVTQKCGFPDEKHCSCVYPLRQEIERLRRKRKSA